MENTLENKSKFFAQYYVQKVAKSPLLNDELPNQRCYPELALNPKNEFYLELTPLSQISDEDAVIVAKLRGFVNIKSIEIVEQGYYVNQPNGRKSFIFFNDMWRPEIDFLRSKSFALPYMGLSVEKQIEYGWVKLKTNEKSEPKKQLTFND